MSDYELPCEPFSIPAGPRRRLEERLGLALAPRTGSSNAGGRLKIAVGKDGTGSVNPGGYRTKSSREESGAIILRVEASDSAGVFAGLQDIAETLEATSGEFTLDGWRDRTHSPRFMFRALKLNLPWDPYRHHPSHYQHQETMMDLSFWETLLDMLFEERYNALTLWELHPFSHMIRCEGWPDAWEFSEEEYSRRKELWTAVFKMAADRCIETYVVFWTIHISERLRVRRGLPGYKETHETDTGRRDVRYHSGDGYLDPWVEEYLRQCISQTLVEYPTLTGIGFSEGERMDQLSPQGRQEWVERVVFGAIKQIDRPVKVIHRALFGGDPDIVRRSIDRNLTGYDVIVEVKFNWSHGHSTPLFKTTHNSHTPISGYWTPAPSTYKLSWMVRNEDFFRLRWAEPEFVRAHIDMNGADYVAGYFVGSECHIPAFDDFTPHAVTRTWTYSFERQWLYYSVWGRLLDRPDCPDVVFVQMIQRRHSVEAEVASRFFRALVLGSKMPLRLGSVFFSTWDFTLYAEGFLAPMPTQPLVEDQREPMITFARLLEQPVLDRTFMCVSEFLAAEQSGGGSLDRITPLKLAGDLEEDADTGLLLISQISVRPDTDFAIEVADATIWLHLSRFMAAKLRGAVEVGRYRRTGSITHLERATEIAHEGVTVWRQVCEASRPYHRESFLHHTYLTPFSWCRYLSSVEGEVEWVRSQVIDC